MARLSALLTGASLVVLSLFAPSLAQQQPPNNGSLSFNGQVGEVTGSILLYPITIGDKDAVRFEGELEGLGRLDDGASYKYGIYNSELDSTTDSDSTSTPTRRSPLHLQKRAQRCPITTMFDPAGLLDPDNGPYQCIPSDYQNTCAVGDLSTKFAVWNGTETGKYYVEIEDITVKLDGPDSVLGKFFIIRDTNENFHACARIAG
ncbi:hypothetical protein H4R34_000718 [Dimargaris verticillata]|uniref:Uncharacterized protein n=1 Tax=Dimargaris verticillata TaxID=2761393 RepID=A0A9W8B6N3_9FUNG|nr:hypothetical protein H4R34_000718 [Dimargaris verticillata]